MKLLIIADDFTGALDTGVQLSKKQIPTYVYSNIDDLTKPKTSCEVLVINANIRHALPIEAYRCIQKILSAFYSPDMYIYLKTDSALRGNLSAVFSAAMDYLEKPLCFIPAFPDLKRTTLNGTAYIDGELLEDSVFRNDPRTPTLESNITNILNKDYALNCQLVSLPMLEQFTTEEPDPKHVYLFDCETNEQLVDIGNILAQKQLYSFTAGCAGFAATFAEHIVFDKDNFSTQKNNQPAVFVSGSANAVTFKQLAFAKEKHFTLFSLSGTIHSYINDIIMQNDIESNSEIITIQEKICKLLQEGKSAIIATASSKKELLDLPTLRNQGKSEETIHNFIAECTSTLVKSILERSSLSNLVVFGGDMVAAILKKCGYNKVRAAGEIAPGVPICQIETESGTLNLVTKSGGFGDEDIIPLIENFLRKDD